MIGVDAKADVWSAFRSVPGECELAFPDPRSADETGLLAIGGDLHVSTLYHAYRSGIFPWPQEGLPLPWFSPLQRGVLEFSEFHIPSRFLREMKKQKWRIGFDEAFAQVVNECARAPRPNQGGTWILPEMQKAYVDLHHAGFAHSVECWADLNSSEVLVGGLYGVLIEGVFSGESMFHAEDGASKRCLVELVGKLQREGLTWIDAQMVTPVLQQFGGKYISRDEFLLKLQARQKEWRNDQQK